MPPDVRLDVQLLLNQSDAAGKGGLGGVSSAWTVVDVQKWITHIYRSHPSGERRASTLKRSTNVRARCEEKDHRGGGEGGRQSAGGRGGGVRCTRFRLIVTAQELRTGM